MAQAMTNNLLTKNVSPYVFGRFSIVVFVALLTGYIVYLGLLQVMSASSKPEALLMSSYDINGNEERKWQLLTDRSTLPDRITLRGAHQRCKGDAKCEASQKVHDTNELMHTRPDYTCDYFRLIGKGDARDILGGQGPYRVCFDTPFRPVFGNCLVYSFGIANDWSFDDTMAGQMGCSVLSFDPSIGLKEHRRADNHQFFPWGISSHDHTLDGKGWLMKSLSSIHKLLGHENIDAEGAEVASFQQLIPNGFLRKYVKQLLVEWHPGSGASTESTLTAYYRLHHEAGFKAFYTEPRFHPTDGLLYLVESLVNTKFNN